MTRVVIRKEATCFALIDLHIDTQACVLFPCSFSARVESRTNDDIPAIASIAKFLNSLDPWLQMHQHRRVAAVLIELMGDILCEMVVLANGADVTEVHVSAVLVDEVEFRRVCGLGDIMAEFDATITRCITTAPSMLALRETTTLLFKKAFSPLVDIARQIVNAGISVLTLRGAPVRLHDAAVLDVVKTLSEHIRDAIALQLPGVIQFFEHSFAQAIGDVIVSLCQSAPSCGAAMKEVRIAFVAALLMPRLVCLPRHAVARVLKLLLSPDNTELQKFLQRVATVRFGDCFRTCSILPDYR